MDKINATCRICLNTDKIGVSMYDQHDSKTYSDLINEYTGLELVQNVNLPHIICEDCNSELSVVIRFIAKVRLSNVKLQELLDVKILIQPSDLIKDESLPLNALIKEEIVFLSHDYDAEDVFSNKDEDDSSKEYFSMEQEEAKFSKPKIPNSNMKSRAKTAKSNNMKRSDMTPKSKIKNKSHITAARKELLRCPICGLKAQNKSILKIHKRKHTGERPYQCDVCKKYFSHRGPMKEHILGVHEKLRRIRLKKLVCDMCGKRFRHKLDLGNHIRVHTGERPFQCTYCPSRFATSSSLGTHIKQHTGDKRHSCHLCGKRFINTNTLKVHLTSHSDEKKFKCKICEKLLKSRFALKKHLKFVHTAEKSCICGKCGAAFALPKSLTKHLKAKHSELSGKCKECDKDFINLEEHMRIHNGVRPFKCLICNKTFTTKRYLSNHSLQHVNASKYTCTYDKCSVSYCKQYLLDYHVKKFHVKKFTDFCQFCLRGFFRNSDVTKHIKLKFCKMSKTSIEPVIYEELKKE